MPDLTAFGFTPTESSAYGALIELGPVGAYALARHLGIARANAYGALDGLVAKGAAMRVAQGGPRRYRGLPPSSVFTRILADQAGKLDRLERELGAARPGASDGITQIHGERAIRDVIIRAIVRARGDVQCLAPGRELRLYAQAIRARLAAGRTIAIWAADGDREGVPGEPGVSAGLDEGARPPDRLVLLLADGALAGLLSDESAAMWSADPIFVFLVRSAIAWLVER
jgi:predicted transcriptional regulator